MIRRPAFRRRLRPGRGFSLLELLVALALISLAALLVPGLLRLGQRAWSTVAGSEASAELLPVRAQIAQRIAGAQPHFAREETGPQIAFRGEPRRMVLLGAGDTVRVAGLAAVEISLVLDRQPGALMLEERPVTPGGPLSGAAAGERRVLLGAVADGRLRYYGPARAGEAADWHDAWPRTDVLPQLVAIELAFAAGDRRVWTPLVVQPRLRPP